MGGVGTGKEAGRREVCRSSYCREEDVSDLAYEAASFFQTNNNNFTPIPLPLLTSIPRTSSPYFLCPPAPAPLLYIRSRGLSQTILSLVSFDNVAAGIRGFEKGERGGGGVGGRGCGVCRERVG